MAAKKKKVEPINIYTCNICGKKFSTKKSLPMHLRMAHGFLAKEASGDDKYTVRPVPDMQAEKTPQPIIEKENNSKEQNVAPLERLVEKIVPATTLPTPSLVIPEIIQKEEIIEVVPIEIETISQSINLEKESKEMDKQEIAELIAVGVKNGLREQLLQIETEKAKQVEKEEAQKRAQVKAQGFKNVINGITQSINDMNKVIKPIEENIKRTVEEAMAGTQADLTALKERLPDNFCISYPDLCARMGNMEKVMKEQAVLEANPEIRAKKDFNCPTCRKSYIDESKNHIDEIIGDDAGLLKQIKDKYNLTVAPKPSILSPKPKVTF